MATQSASKKVRRLFIGLLIILIPLIGLFLVDGLNYATTPDTVNAAPLQQTTYTVRFSNSSYGVDEDEGSIDIEVRLSPEITTTDVVTVEYLTTDGTATEGAGEDYLEATGILTFTSSSDNLAGSSVEFFTVTILDDTTDEPDETINLILRNPSPAGLVSLGNPNTSVLTIDDDDLPPTDTPTPVTGTPVVFVDGYEPNDSLQNAYTTSSGTRLCNATLWPSGDVDFYRFYGKAGSVYRIFTDDLDPGLDTALKVYNTQGNEIASNDDFEVTQRYSQVTITANTEGFYYARIVNRDPSDPTGKTYCFEVEEIFPPTPTPSSTALSPEVNDCEFNSTLETACTIGLGQTYTMNFVPVFGSAQDTDVFRLWMKPGIEYTCETAIPDGSFADTNIIFLDNNGNDFQPNLGNDDKELGDLGSKLSYLSQYTGWLYIMVGPVNVPDYEESDNYRYTLECTSTTATATPTATNTRPFVPQPAATNTPVAFPTFPPTPTPIDLSSLATAVPPTPPQVQFQPLPTATPPTGGQQLTTVNVTLYYDANTNFMPELTEGILDVAVALYDNSSNQLIAFGYTNEAGMVRFDSVATTGPVRVVVPFLNYSQIAAGASADILLRVAPQPLPSGIP